MEQSVTAIFDTYAAASQAVDRVRREGVADRDVSIMSNDTSMERSKYGDYRHDADSEAGTGAGTGATMGAVAGGAAGLMAGMGLLAIPGLGPVVAAGWLAATLVGAGAGGAAGGLVGALVGSGMSEDEAHGYAEGLRRGGSVVTVRVRDGGDAARIRQVLNEGSYDLTERSQSWRSEGWAGRAS